MSAQPPRIARKTLYHSDIRRISPLGIQLVHHPRESRFAGRPAYAELVIPGTAGTHHLVIENQSVRATLSSLPIGVPVTVAATGSKETAALHVVQIEEDATLPYPDAPDTKNATQPRLADAGASATPAEHSLARTYYAALDAAEQLLSAFRQGHGREPTEVETRVAACLYIEHMRSGARRPLTSPRSAE